MRNRLRGVVFNFLATFLSRNCDIGGYWLPGLIVEHVGPEPVDVLSDTPLPNAPQLRIIKRAARERFLDQLDKDGIPRNRVVRCMLRFNRQEEKTTGFVNGYEVQGYTLTVTAEVTSDLGKVYSAEKVVFVSPHNPQIERRSTRSA
jgi:hypothetical protein